MVMKIPARLAIAGLCTLALLQFVRPGIPSGPATAEIQVPPQVRQILQRDCYSCHSNERRLAWFDEITPSYWLVRHDILAAREHLNFSTLGNKPAALQRATLYEAVNMIQLGAMPLPQFTALHQNAKVTPEELAGLKAYLAPWGTVGDAVSAPSSNVAEAAVRVNLKSVPAELNGVPFEPGFESWKAISFTDRGDNNTLRVILGNDIAVKAAEAGNISPWPNGTRFAKVAWQQLAGADGLIHPGKFVQVEFMVKDAERYRNTEGWGWGRWRGLDLKPYGANSRFAGECTGCHEPVSGNDFVYTLPITLAKADRDEVVNNRAGALPQSLPYGVLGWNVLTMFVDPKAHTMAALFGNDTAMRAVSGGGLSVDRPPAYPSGSALALVTWSQREDPHWFGGRIPDKPLSVEFAEIDASGKARSYRRYDGPLLKEHTFLPEEAARQSTFLLNLAPATLP